MFQDKSLGETHNSPGGGHIGNVQILQRRKDPGISFKRLVTQSPSSLTDSPSEQPQPYPSHRHLIRGEEGLAKECGQHRA